jgi:O-antigen/teichoic acid export membrane protein
VSFDSHASERSLIRRTALLSAAQYGAAAVGFATALLAARWLGPHSFGVASVIIAYPTLVWSLASVKTSAVTQRYVSGFYARRQQAELLAVCKLGFVVDFGISMLAMTLVFLIVFLAGDLPGTDGDSDLVALFALSLPFGSFVGTSIVVLFAVDRVGRVAVLQVGQKVFVLIAVLAALLVHPNSAALVIGTGVGQAASGLLYLVVASATLAQAGKGRWWKARWSVLEGYHRELRSLLSWNFLSVTLSGALVQVPLILLGALRSPVDAGYFRLASTIAVTADAVEASMSRLAYSTLAVADAKADVQRAARLVVNWSRREARLGVLAVLAGMALLPGFVLIALGDRFTGMIAGAELLLAGTAVSTGFFYLMPYLYSRGQVRKWVSAYGIYALVSLGACALVTRPGGFVAVAAVVGIGLAMLNAALGVPILRHAHRTMKSRGPLERVSAPSAGFGDRS